MKRGKHFVARIALAQSGAAHPRTPRYADRRRGSTWIWLVAISGLLSLRVRGDVAPTNDNDLRCTRSGSFGQRNGRRLHRLGFVWPRRHATARRATRGGAIWRSL